MKKAFIFFLIISGIIKFKKDKDKRALFLSLMMLLVLLGQTCYRHLIFTDIGIVVSGVVFILGYYSLVSISIEFIKFLMNPHKHNKKKDYQ